MSFQKIIIAVLILAMIIVSILFIFGRSRAKNQEYNSASQNIVKQREYYELRQTELNRELREIQAKISMGDSVLINKRDSNRAVIQRAILASEVRDSAGR